MNKVFILAFLIISFTVIDLSARGTWKILNQTYTVDTLNHATVGPGTTETELRIEATVNGKQNVNNIFYTETDLDNPYVEMRAAKAGNHMRMLETVPDIADRMQKPGEQYFAGVNADFFNMGFPYNAIGMCLANGFLTNYETDGADIDPYYIIFNEKGLPAFARHINRAWEGYFQFPDGNTYPFHLNTVRNEDDLILYTPQWQAYFDGKYGKVGYTDANPYGVEVRIKPVGKNVLYGNNLSFEVLETPELNDGNTNGNAKIPEDGYVLSGHGECRKFLRNLKKGDVVKSWISFSADNKQMQAKELLGGFPRILTNGKTLPVLSYPEHLANPEPRTAVGYTTDRRRLVMLVVDGRNAGGSAGVTQRQLGDIMRNIGCSDAMNFDGGGSSTMYVDGFGVKNVPSSSSLDQRPEGTPRTVVNALFAVAVAPVDKTIASIELRDKKVNLATGESYTPVVYGYNQYGVLVSTDVVGCTVRVPAEIATVDGNRITGADGNYSGILTADYNGLTHSVPVYLNGGGTFVAGINEITVDGNSSETEYYQLNGVRVSNPATGQVSIVKKGGQTSKQLIH